MKHYMSDLNDTLLQNIVKTSCRLLLWSYNLFYMCKGLSTEVWSCNTRKKNSFENLYFLVTNVFSVSKLILWYLNMSSIDLATQFKIIY